MRLCLNVAMVLASSALVACSTDSTSPASLPAQNYLSLVGAIHDHTGYSDGVVGTTPATELARASANGLAYLLTSEHTYHPRAAGPESQYC
jgi:hypothetical protein